LSGAYFNTEQTQIKGAECVRKVYNAVLPFRLRRLVLGVKVHWQTSRLEK